MSGKDDWMKKQLAVRSSRLVIRPGERPQNPRSTATGRAIDRQARGNMPSKTGWDAGHLEPLSLGGDPSKVFPQNPLINRYGTGRAFDARTEAKLARNPSLGMERESKLLGSRREVPAGLRVVQKYTDGSVEEVIFGNFPTAASRRAAELKAQGKELAPGEAQRLNLKQWADIKGHGKGPRNIQKSRIEEKWWKMKEQKKAGVPLTPEQKKAMLPGRGEKPVSQWQKGNLALDMRGTQSARGSDRIRSQAKPSRDQLRVNKVRNKKLAAGPASDNLRKQPFAVKPESARKAIAARPARSSMVQGASDLNRGITRKT
jgi:hypothetical protein